MFFAIFLNQFMETSGKLGKLLKCCCYSTKLAF